jgi:hypothetical protein
MKPIPFLAGLVAAIVVLNVMRRQSVNEVAITDVEDDDAAKPPLPGGATAPAIVFWRSVPYYLEVLPNTGGNTTPFALYNGPRGNLYLWNPVTDTMTLYVERMGT